MKDFPLNEIDFGRCWSSVAGERSGVMMAIAEAERRSANAFIQRQDAVANALRDLAVELHNMAKKLSDIVDSYIEEDRKRRYVMQKIIGVGVDMGAR